MAGKIQFYLLDLTYKIIADKAQICIFGKTPENEKLILLDQDFRPYFYIIPEKSSSAVLDKLRNLKVEKRDIIAAVTDTEIVKKRYMGEDVEAIKVYANLPKAVPALANEAKKWDTVKSCYEYDILFTRRYLIDKNLVPMTLHEASAEETHQGFRIKTYNISDISPIGGDYLENQRILAFDIETYHPGGKIDSVKNPIIMISFLLTGTGRSLRSRRPTEEGRHLPWTASASA